MSIHRPTLPHLIDGDGIKQGIPFVKLSSSRVRASQKPAARAKNTKNYTRTILALDR